MGSPTSGWVPGPGPLWGVSLPQGPGRIGTVLRLQRSSYAWRSAPAHASPCSSPRQRSPICRRSPQRLSGAAALGIPCVRTPLSTTRMRTCRPMRVPRGVTCHSRSASRRHGPSQTPLWVSLVQGAGFTYSRCVKNPVILPGKCTRRHTWDARPLRRRARTVASRQIPGTCGRRSPATVALGRRLHHRVQGREPVFDHRMLIPWPAESMALL